MVDSSSAQNIVSKTLGKVERLGIQTNGSTETVNQCLDVIAQAFVRQPSTAMYLADPKTNGIRFWRTMAEETLLSLPADSKPLYALMRDGTQQPCAVALAYSWHPGKIINSPQTDEMVRPEVEYQRNACGSIWHEVQMDAYFMHGEFINIDFIGVVPKLADDSLRRILLKAILQDADVEGKAVFLAASGLCDEKWYARYGFHPLLNFYSKLPDVPGYCDLTFMVHPCHRK